MWYDQTKKNALPNAILATALHEIGPGYDASETPMANRATVLWNGPKGQPNYNIGYLFAAPAALNDLSMTPLVIPIDGTLTMFNAVHVGYIGEPSGHRAPGYERTPLPNHLHAYILTAVKAPTSLPGDLVIRPIFTL